MDAAEHPDVSPIPQPQARVVSPCGHAEGKPGRTSSRIKLADDIDNLRQIMAETFLKETSFTADPVILISRQLDLKINEYMKQSHITHRKAR